MNKHKKGLDSLRRHLGRDTVGLDYLDAIARDLAEQRKRIAALEESEARALTRAEGDRKELDHAKTQIAQLKAEVEREQSKRVAADTRAKRQTERIAAMESDVEAGDEDSASQAVDDWSRKMLKLFKDVRRRYKRAPAPDGGLQLDDLLVDYTGDEFMGIGMVVASLALFTGRVRVVSDRQLKDARLPEESIKNIVRWLKPWIRPTKLEDKIYHEFGS